MNETHAPPAVLKEIPRGERIKVVLMDADNLAMARGTMVLSLSNEAGLFWPDCPMPRGPLLNSASSFTLPDDGVVRIALLTLRAGTPPHYGFSLA